MKSSSVGWGIDRHLGGQLLHTVDGGRTWTNVTPPGVPFGIPTYTTMQANALPEPPDDTVTWVRSGSAAMTVTERSRSIRGAGVLEFSKTTDGGRHWHQWTVHLGHLADGVIGNPSLYQVDFVSANDGWLQFLPGSSSTASMTILGMELWHTTNGGRAWTRVNQISPQSGVAVSSVTFTNATTGWITESKLYHNPRLLYTTNAGHTWVPLASRSFPQNITSAAMLSATTYVVATLGEGHTPDGLYETHDGGRVWTNLLRLAPSLAGNLDVSFPSPKVGYLLVEDDMAGVRKGSAGGLGQRTRLALMKTSNGGKSWMLRLLPNMPHAWYASVAFSSPTTGLIAVQGTVWKTENGGTRWVEEGP